MESHFGPSFLIAYFPTICLIPLNVDSDHSHSGSVFHQSKMACLVLVSYEVTLSFLLNTDDLLAESISGY